MFKVLRDRLKTSRHSGPLEAALVPAHLVVIDQPAEFAMPALDGAQDGRFEPAAELLAATREQRAWDDRSHVFRQLTEFSLRSPAWLHLWAAQAPDNPDLVTLRADLMVRQAWEARSGRQSDLVSRQEFAGFHQLLHAATRVIQRAMELAPDDPEPLRVALTHARGLELPRAVVDQRLTQLRQIAPTHYEGNSQALQYLCEKWFGSHAEMYGFAVDAVRSAPEDSHIQVLLLVAAYEHDVADSGAARAEQPALLDEAYTRAEVFARSGAGAPHARSATRNLLADMYLRDRQYSAAYEQLLGIGPYVSDFPWCYYGDDPRGTYLRRRRYIVAGAAKRT